MKLLACEICGSIDIETKVWINPNTHHITDIMTKEPGENDSYCNNCHEFTNLKEICTNYKKPQQ